MTYKVFVNEVGTRTWRDESTLSYECFLQNTVSISSRFGITYNF